MGFHAQRSSESNGGNASGVATLAQSDWKILVPRLPLAETVVRALALYLSVIDIELYDIYL
jgi:hypothetical protein